jgi:hypothetical protein
MSGALTAIVSSSQPIVPCLGWVAVSLFCCLAMAPASSSSGLACTFHLTQARVALFRVCHVYKHQDFALLFTNVKSVIA